MRKLVIVIISIVCFSCSNTKLVSSWENSHLKSEQIKSLAVVALMKNKVDAASFENGVVRIFSKRGVKTAFGNQVLETDKKYSEQEYKDALKNSGVQAIIFFKLIGLDKQHVYNPPSTYVYGGGFYGGGPYGGYYFPQPYGFNYWWPGYQVVTTPGYWSETKNYQIEVAVYNASDDQLLYIARTATFQPYNATDLGESISVKVFQDLKKRGLVPSKKHK
ncbi:hypothetical protein [Aureibacter tunicatorum]|uniref:DUF4136 domain-containing protein n=1 Tax=Aureibacter tunicatorum TaxID=866807 RepID=A0AAE4BSH4_9BACT|nr:hypothetical protein [Aureibacter tunicatorum]MDR6238407.1 hypothetical protein [Aureibacter tunicatorum]